jgi:hypothetical protein
MRQSGDGTGEFLRRPPHRCAVSSEPSLCGVTVESRCGRETTIACKNNINDHHITQQNSRSLFG